MMKKVVLTLLVFMLASNAMASYYSFNSQGSGGFRGSGTNWSGTGWNNGVTISHASPMQRSDVAYVRGGHNLTLNYNWGTYTGSTGHIRKLFVGHMGGTGNTWGGNGSVTIQSGGRLRTAELHVGNNKDGTGAAGDWTGRMIVEAGGTLEANSGYNDGWMYIGDGGMGTDHTGGNGNGNGVLDIAGRFLTGANPGNTNATTSEVGDNTLHIGSTFGSKGTLIVRGAADIDIAGKLTTYGSQSKLVFNVNGATVDIGGQVTIADGTVFKLESAKFLSGSTAITILTSATGITINLANVTVSGSGTLSQVGNSLVMTVPEPMTIALLGLGGVFLRRRRRA